MYNKTMTDIDKFFSDSDRLMARGSATGKIDCQKLASELTRLFLTWTRDYGELGSNLAAYWIEQYSTTLSTPEGRKQATEWFGSLLSLLSNSFTAEMDFSDKDWDEIRENVSAEADNLDLELITSIMMIIVERGKA
jgi:hypothetical protein